MLVCSYVSHFGSQTSWLNVMKLSTNVTVEATPSLYQFLHSATTHKTDEMEQGQSTNAGPNPHSENHIYIINQYILVSGVYSASNRNEYQKHKKIIIFLGSKVRWVRRADILTAICEPII
jgi:hypothetical protein